MDTTERSSRLALNCCRCGRLKRPDDLVLDRHGKHYCEACAEAVDLCTNCGSTNIDDDSLYGQLHY